MRTADVGARDNGRVPREGIDPEMGALTPASAPARAGIGDEVMPSSPGPGDGPATNRRWTSRGAFEAPGSPRWAARGA